MERRRKCGGRDGGRDGEETGMERRWRCRGDGDVEGGEGGREEGDRRLTCNKLDLLCPGWFVGTPSRLRTVDRRPEPAEMSLP